MEGLALAIFGAMICMVVVPALFFGGLGWLALRGQYGWVGGLVGAALGVGVGAIAVTMTFFEDTWSPPRLLELEVPAGFAHEWVYVVGDPAVSTEVAWSGVSLPFTSPRGRVSVPRSGVVRVRSLAHLDGERVDAVLVRGGGSGPRNVSFAALTLPPAAGSGRVVAFGFAPWPGREPEPPSDPDALAARIAELERER